MVDGQIKDPSAENPDLSKFLSSNPEAGLNITLHVSPTARNSSFLNSCLPGLFYLISPNPLQT